MDNVSFKASAKKRSVDKLMRADWRMVECEQYKCPCQDEDVQAELSQLAAQLAEEWTVEGRAERTRWALKKWNEVGRKFENISKYPSIYDCSRCALLFIQFVCKQPTLDYSNTDNRDLHRDTYRMLREMINYYSKSIWKQYGPALVEHLCEELRWCADGEVLVDIGRTIIKCVNYCEVPSSKRREVVGALQPYARYFEEKSRKRSLYEVDMERYRVGLVAKAILDQEEQFFDTRKSWPSMQLVNGCWAVRNDHIYHRIPALVAYPLQHGALYFEVRMLTSSRKMQVGWTSRLTDFDRKYRIFKDALYTTFNNTSAGTIVGTLLDLEQQKVKFYLNGQRLEDIEVKPSSFDFTPFFATVCLPPFQTVILNIGQEPFRYQPNDHIDSIYSAAEQAGQSCWLMEPIEWGGKYVFNYSQLPQALPPLFDDEKQREVDRVVRKEMDRVLKGGRVDEETSKEMQDKYGRCRPVQSIVEVLGEGLEDDELAVMAWWVAEVGSRQRIRDYSENTQYALISYYMQQSLSPENMRKHRQMCVLMASWRCHESGYGSSELLWYLVAILGQMEDGWMQLYAMVALTEYDYKYKQESFKKAIEAIKASEEVWKQITTWAGEFDAEDELKGRVDGVRGGVAVRLQRYLVAQRMVQRVQGVDRKSGAEEDRGRLTLTRLSAQDKSFYLQLSPSGLMARSDHYDCQSVRSEFAINPGTFYFEVTILTSGPMRIGLAARQMEIKNRNKTRIGSNALSIGFDGYHGCVWMHDQQYQPKHPLPRWRVGDVVGVYFDSYARLVTFTLNGQPVELTENPFATEFIFSKLETHVALTLDTHQQVYCNFQCTTIPAALKGQSIQITNITNSTVINSPILSNSQLTCRDINQTYHNSLHPSPSSPLSTPIPDFRLCRVLSTLLLSTDPAKLQHNLSPPILNDLETIVGSIQQQHQGHDDQDTIIHILSEQMKGQIGEFKGQREGRKAVMEQEETEEDADSTKRH